jgi:hypothetical protein
MMLQVKKVPVATTKLVVSTDHDAPENSYWCMVLHTGVVQAMFRWPDRLLTYLDENGKYNDVVRLKITAEGVELVKAMTNEEFRNWMKISMLYRDPK